METGALPQIILTAKQRAVLDRLLDHKSSKQIAKELGISPYTVDQRMQVARGKFGASSRSELALLYRQQRDLCGETAYQSSQVAGQAIKFEHSPSNDALAERTLIPPRWVDPLKADQGQLGRRLVPEMFEGPYGTLARLGAILMLAALFLFVGLASLSMFGELSGIFRG